MKKALPTIRGLKLQRNTKKIRRSQAQWRALLNEFEQSSLGSQWPMALYDFLAPHWLSLRISNLIESSFGMCAEKNWRKLCGFNYQAKVVTSVEFKGGVEVIQIHDNQVTA